MGQSRSALIEELKQLPGAEDPHLSKRSEPRTMLRTRATLDLRRENGQTICVSALDVSDSGIGFLCREDLKDHERIGLRIAFQNDRHFEDFIVQRGTSTVGGYKVGVLAQ